MDWVHCNICFKQPFTGEQNFFLTSCGHIYCTICLNSENKEKCKVCGNSFTTTHLTNQMQAEVQEYFKNPMDQLKKLVQVIQFQDGHRQKYLFYSKQATAKYKAAKEEMKKLFDANKVLKKKNKELEMALQNKTKELDLVKQHYSKQRQHLSDLAPIHRSSGHNSTKENIDAAKSVFSESPNNFQHPSQGSIMRTAPNRLTLPYNSKLTPQSKVSPANSYMSTPRRSDSQQSNQLKKFQTPQSTQQTYLDQYRSREPYSSQQNTPASFSSSGYKSSKSPISPGYSPTVHCAHVRVGMSPLLTQSILSGRPSLTPPTTGIELINLYSQAARSGQK